MFLNIKIFLIITTERNYSRNYTPTTWKYEIENASEVAIFLHVCMIFKFNGKIEESNLIENILEILEIVICTVY